MSEIKPNIEVWDIEKLVPYEKNAKKHPPEQIAKIAESIKKFGWTQAITVDKDGIIINGHGRRLAALSLKQAKVPVWVRDDLSEEEVKAARIADNRASISDLDMNALQEEMASINIDLMSGIFDAKELDFMLSADIGEINADLFIDDVGGAVDEQQEEMKGHIKGTAERRVPINKVLEFKDIAGKDELHVTRFMALIQTDYPADTVAESFVKFAQNYYEKYFSPDVSHE